MTEPSPQVDTRTTTRTTSPPVDNTTRPNAAALAATSAQTITTTNNGGSDSEEQNSGWTLMRMMYVAVGGLIGLIVLTFVIGLVLVLADAAYWAPIVQVIRDILTIILTVQGIFIIAASGVLVAQVARFVNLLRSEVKPITDDAKHAMRNVRTTTEFVKKQAVEPIIRTQSFMAGLVVFLREIARFSRVLQRNQTTQEDNNHDD